MSQLSEIQGDNKAVQKGYQARRRDPTGRFCECGKPAYRYKHSEHVCQRCDRLESVYGNHYVVDDVKRFKPMEELSRIRVQFITRKSLVERMAEFDRGENRFIAIIRDSPDEITIVGHGEYHLTILKEAA